MAEKGSKAASEKGAIDSEAPAAVTLEVRTPSGEVWGQIVASHKEFKTGSVGYYANGKVINPKTGSRYQVGASIILIGSKKS